MTTKAHTHYCPKCRRDVACPVAARGGCLFASTDAMTCNPCAENEYPFQGHPDTAPITGRRFLSYI